MRPQSHAAAGVAPRTDVEACAETFRARIRERRLRCARRADSLRAQAAVVARRLGRELGARRVWLFGSLAWGEPHERSDVDLLVEGLAAADWSRAMGLVEELVPAPVDLVRLEEAAAALAERVLAEGVLLHDRR